jgi:hypothetical protein
MNENEREIRAALRKRLASLSDSFGDEEVVQLAAACVASGQ